MNIVLLTVEERLYLPALFHRVLEARAADTRAIFMCPAKYGGQSTRQLIGKYRAAFGWFNLLRLARRQVQARACDLLALGRSRQHFHSIKSVARYHGVACETVSDMNAAPFLERLRKLQTELIVSISCPQIFRKPLIDLPPKGCLNVHGAKLPAYRGVAPSFWMMRNGEQKAGVTVFFVKEAIDLGNVVAADEFPILPDETLDEFIVRSRQIHADTLLRALRKIERGGFEPRALSAEDGSYCTFPTRQAYREFRRRGRRLW